VAKSSKGASKNSKTDTSVEDIVDVDDVAIESVDADAPIAVEEAALELEADAPEGVEDEADNGPISEPALEEIPTETVPQAEGAPAASFFPLLLGGAVAGAIGFGVAAFFPLSSDTDALRDQVATQSDQIAALEAQLSAASAVDYSAIETQISDAAERSAGQLENVAASLGDQLSALETRVSDVEKAPSADGTLSQTAIAAYQQELEELRAELMTRQEAVMTAAAQTEAELEAAREEALATAQAAASRAVLNRVSAAVETGVPFADVLADLEGTDLPIALSTAAEAGVATTAELTGAFPAAARAALATARAEGVSDDAGGIGGFLRNQFDVRSTAPQEGPGPDAVLSRAEAAIKEGRVADALAEIEALPEVVRAEMTDWTARATERAHVLDAISTLSETYN